jgi:electron transport complex protein RnfD
MDGSAILTGLLLALSLPPWAPWWIAVLGGAFAMVVGKHVFGGLGANVFNPAMLARVALLVSFPLEMTTWANPAPLFAAGSPGFLEGLAITFQGIPDMDAVSSASYLGHVKTELTQGAGVSSALQNVYNVRDAILGSRHGSLGETPALLLLAGGLLLLAKRIISWHVPLSMLATIALFASVMHFLDPEQYTGPLFHVLAGSTILGAFFIATDLVTSPSTRRGQLVFGAGCGLLIYVIRTWGGYPEGLSFAVLLMNAVTPIIDYYIKPRVYGRTYSGSSLEYSAEKISSKLNKDAGS